MLCHFRATQYVHGSHGIRDRKPVNTQERVGCFKWMPWLYLQICLCPVSRNMVWLSSAYYVEKVGRILLIVDSGSGKAYRMDFRCVSGGSHKRNTQMVQILRLTDGNCIGMRFLHSASLRSK